MESFMKIALIGCLCLLILCTSGSKLVQTSVPSSSINLRNRILSSEELYQPIDIKKKLLMDENNCKVYVPWIVDEKYNDININIKSFIMDRIDSVMDMGWDDRSFINFDYVISYNHNEVLSFYFLEKSFLGLRSHEFLTGINIDMQSGNFIPIADLIVVDETFLDKLFSYINDKYERQEYISNYIMENYELEEILEMIKNEIGISYYFNKDFIYVSFPLTQALTYHMEFGIDWENNY